MPSNAGENGTGEPQRRRKRYSGRNPRHFEEKYKELSPEKYPDDVAHILASGKTPAGSHRSICVAEVLALLAPQPGELAVDATLGAGGHALQLLPHLLPGGKLIGIDVDPVELARASARIQAAGFEQDQFVAVHSNMAGLLRVLALQGVETADLVLADLGCSSMQLDDPERGFSYKLDGPLDLRMNPRKGAPASALLARSSELQLAAMLREHADEPQAGVIASAIVAARAREPILRTTQLANLVRAALPPRTDASVTLARVFQALRIEVGDEMSALSMFLRNLPRALSPGGRVAILTFHSGEDRRVKRAFREGLDAGDYVSIARSVVRPSREEVRANPRASSAKLRWARRPDRLVAQGGAGYQGIVVPS